MAISLKRWRCEPIRGAIEVKSDRVHDTQPGLAAFTETFKPHRKLLLGGDGLSVEGFLAQPVGHWLRP